MFEYIFWLQTALLQLSVHFCILENLSAKQKEDLRQVDDVGSNMVKRLLKNYESYQVSLFGPSRFNHKGPYLYLFF